MVPVLPANHATSLFLRNIVIKHSLQIIGTSRIFLYEPRRIFVKLNIISITDDNIEVCIFCMMQIIKFAHFTISNICLKFDTFPAFTYTISVSGNASFNISATTFVLCLVSTSADQ